MDTVNSSQVPAGAPRCAHERGFPARAGVGLKPEHFTDIVGTWPDIGFFEIHAENYFVAGGPFHHYLSRICEHYPLSIHGVGLSIGGEGRLDTVHLQRLRNLLNRYPPAAFSEHLAWSSHGGTFFNDLLPMPYNRLTLENVCAHIDQVQSVLGRRMLLENPATYVEFTSSTYAEGDFLSEIIRRTGCGLLLDVNNLFIACCNHGRDFAQSLHSFPLHAVEEIHLAGFHQEHDSLGAPLLIDTHGRAVDKRVWQHYEHVLRLMGPKPTLIEWDNDVPTFNTLYAEANRAESSLQQYTREVA